MSVRVCARASVGGSEGGVGQLGMAHPSDGPASSLRMFGHVHRAMCSDGCRFEVLEEHVCACIQDKTNGASMESVGAGGCRRCVGERRRVPGGRWRMSVKGGVADRRP